MSLIHELKHRLHNAEQLVEARKDRLDALVKPVLAALGQDRVGVESVDIHKNWVDVTYGWSCKGIYNNHTMSIPLSVFEADDPGVAAIRWKEAKAEAARKADRLHRLKEFEALKTEFEPTN